MTEHEQSILLARLDERYQALDEKLDRVLDQTTKTNGRVTKAEESISKLENWQSESKGERRATFVIATVIGGLVSALIAWLKN